MISYSQPCRRSTPSTSIVWVPAPLMRAPMRESISAVPWTSGSAAALTMRVRPRAVSGGEHQVLGAEHAGVVAEDRRAFERQLRFGDEALALTMDLRAEGGEAGEVHVDGSLADDVAARLRAGGLAEAAEERAHHEEAAAQGGCDVHRGSGAVEVRGVDAEGVRAGPLDLRAEAAQDFGHLLDVADVGDVLEDALFGDGERGGHRAEGGVLRAADGDRAVEGVAALDDEGAGVRLGASEGKELGIGDRR